MLTALNNLILEYILIVYHTFLLVWNAFLLIYSKLTIKCSAEKQVHHLVFIGKLLYKIKCSDWPATLSLSNYIHDVHTETINQWCDSQNVPSSKMIPNWVSHSELSDVSRNYCRTSLAPCINRDFSLFFRKFRLIAGDMNIGIFFISLITSFRKMFNHIYLFKKTINIRVASFLTFYSK